MLKMSKMLDKLILMQSHANSGYLSKITVFVQKTYFRLTVLIKIGSTRADLWFLAIFGQNQPFFATFPKSNPVGYQEIQKRISSMNFRSLAPKPRNCHFLALFGSFGPKLALFWLLFQNLTPQAFRKCKNTPLVRISSKSDEN